MEKNISLSIVIPCFNENDNIPILLEKFDQVMEPDIDIEVVLVENGSTDDSATTIQKLLPKYRFARVVTVEVNQGYGYGILRGLETCKSEYIGWTHADLQTDPKDVINAYHHLQHGNIFVKGNRKNRSVFDQFFTTGMSIFETLLLRVRLSDINGQPNIFPRTFYEKWQSPPNDFSLDLYAFYQARKMKMDVIRLDVQFPNRINGESKWNNEGMKSKIKFIKRTVSFSLELKRRGIR